MLFLNVTRYCCDIHKKHHCIIFDAERKTCKLVRCISFMFNHINIYNDICELMQKCAIPASIAINFDFQLHDELFENCDGVCKQIQPIRSHIDMN